MCTSADGEQPLKAAIDRQRRDKLDSNDSLVHRGGDCRPDNQRIEGSTSFAQPKLYRMDFFFSFGGLDRNGAEQMKCWMVAVAVVALIAPSMAYARGGKTMAENGQVVHSRRAGVIMHRAVPPFRGVHVYEGRQSKNMPYHYGVYGPSGYEMGR